MTYIFLHGAWHASWCWRDIKPALEQQGHTVFTLDLPGHGDNPMPFADINLQTYVDCVLAKIDHLYALPGAENPIVLVGHSMAGAVISQVAEYIPQKIAQLIYISAFMPKDQESISDQARQLSAAGVSGVSTEMVRDKANNAIQLKASSRLRDLFYGMCSQADADYALSKLAAEPSKPHLDKLTLSAQKFGRVKKRYIVCLQDKVVLPVDQQEIYQGRVDEVVRINADHSPFFSAKLALLGALS